MCGWDRSSRAGARALVWAAPSQGPVPREPIDLVKARSPGVAALRCLGSLVAPALAAGVRRHGWPEHSFCRRRETEQH